MSLPKRDLRIGTLRGIEKNPGSSCGSRMATEGLELHIQGMWEDREPIPHPASFGPAAPIRLNEARVAAPHRHSGRGGLDVSKSIRFEPLGAAQQ